MSAPHGPEHQPQAVPDNQSETNNNQKTEIPEGLDINNQPGFFERVRNNTREFVGSVKTTARIGTVERLQTWWNDSAYRRQDQKTEKLAAQHGDRDREAHALEDRIRRQDMADADMQHRFGNSSERSGKSKKDRETLMHRLEQVKNDREIARLNLESANYKKRVYEKKVKDIAHGVIDRVNERLEPQEARLEVMQARKQQLDAEISTFQSNIEETTNIIQQISRAREKGAEFDFDKDALAEQIREIELQVRDFQRNLDQRVKESGRLENSKKSVQGKTVSWQSKRTQYEKVLNRESKYAQPNTDQEKMSEVRARMDALSQEDREKQKIPNKLDPEQMLKLWNSVMGSKLRITAKQFSAFVDSRLKQEGVNYLTFKYIVGEITSKKISESDWKIFENEVQKTLVARSRQAKPETAPDKPEVQNEAGASAQLAAGEHPEEDAMGVVAEPAGEMPEPVTPQGQSGEVVVEDSVVESGEGAEEGEGASKETANADREFEPIERKLRRFDYQGFSIRELVSAWNERFSKEYALDPKAFEEDTESMFPDRKNKKFLTMRNFKGIIENQFAHLTSGAVGVKKEEIEAFKEGIEKFKAFFIENKIGKLDGYVDPESAEFYDQETELASLCDFWNDLSDDADDEVTPEQLKDFEPNILEEGKSTLGTGTFLEAVGSYRKKTLPRYDKNKEKKTTGWFSKFLIRRWGLKKKK